MVSIQNGRCTPIPFTQMVDPVSGRAKARMVDITARSYQSARQYMIRLSDEDLKDPVALARCAALAELSSEAFHHRFQPGGSNVRGTQTKGGAP